MDLKKEIYKEMKLIAELNIDTILYQIHVQ